MNYRIIAGVFILLAVLLILPAAALPDIGGFSLASGPKTGVVWVTIDDLNSSVGGEPVAMTYALGDVTEINPAYVNEDAATGLVTVTMSGSEPARSFFFYPGTSAGSEVYSIKTVTVARESEPLLVSNKAFAVVPATANYYTDIVPKGKQHEWVDLDWKDADKDLALTIFAPDATFGPYMDIADGRKDGRIFLDFSSLLNVTDGNWFFKVDSNGKPSTSYTLNTYSA